MPTTCHSLQIKILDLPAEAPDAARLTDSEMGHVQSCEECRQFFELSQTMTPVLGALGRDARRRGAYSPAGAQALKARVLARSRDKMEQIGGGRRDGVLAAMMDWLRPRPALRWSMALLACVVLGGAWFWHSRPVGTLTFAQAGLRIENLDLKGLVNQALARGAHLATSSAGGAIAELDGSNQIRLALAPDTQLELAGPRVLRLTKGSVWLNVNPKGRGFKVLTPQGEVVVTGTIFGVKAEERQVRVEVARGQVKVLQGKDQQAVGAGQEVIGSPASISDPSPRSMGTALPVWVDELGQAEALARAAKSIPSLDIKRKGAQ